MYVKRKIGAGIVLKFSWRNLLIFLFWSGLVTATYFYLNREFGIDISIPFLPLSTIGVAVAFYVGFKNNQSYDRFWEARKIWGGVVNYSRTWANQVLSFVTLKHAVEQISDSELQKIHKEMIYRHIAWINSLRLQLRKTTIFDRKNLSYVPDLKLEHDKDCDWAVGQFLEKEEFEETLKKSNSATAIVRNQGERLKELERAGLIEDFRHMEMMRVLEEFYNLQGMCERIKNTPFPRQYAYFSSVFVGIFIFLLPFGLVGEFAKVGLNSFVWATIPFSMLISWIFSTMEVVGDNSEDPFENYINDVPMTALCRTIEIDLREMINDENIPEKIQPKNNILM